MDDLAKQILSRFEARADEIAEEIASSTVAEVEGFHAVNDGLLNDEIRTLARRHLDAFLRLARAGGPVSAAVLNAARERAVQRAREMVPLAALVHSYLIAQRVISAAIAREADIDARSRDAALALIATTFDYNIAVTAAMADAYLQVVQGDLAELDSARRGLIEALLTSEPEQLPALARHATGLGFDPDRQVVAVVAVLIASEHEPLGPARWAAHAIARCSGRPERSAFVVRRERDIVALLDAGGSHPVRVVLERAGASIKNGHDAVLRAGVGTPFSGVGGFASSYREARRALKHATDRRPLVFGPEDVPLFDELTSSARDDAATLIPAATRYALGDPATRETVEAFFAADLQVSAAATALTLHPNSLRYRLRRITELTGRDPRRLTDLLELITAARLMTKGSATAVGNGAAADACAGRSRPATADWSSQADPDKRSTADAR